ncbi:MAG: DegT/DnrJ/EryC1/StrS family aminotransferase [Nitrospinae bacterium]|nr:DegT/DnrJ/EryC1/StrS family aminotransferase [Nitrospinota bacterium]
MVPHSKPTLDEEDARAVADVVHSGYIAEGEKVLAFEAESARLAGKKYAAAVSSGTAALHLSLLSLGIGSGDFVALPSFVCASLFHAIGMAGAKPLLVDIDPATFLIDQADLEKKIMQGAKAVIVPHPFGFPEDMESIRRFGVPVLEDCAQSIGARLGGKPVGAFGEISLFSFYATKVLATGEGGMACSDSLETISRIKDWREYDNKGDLAQRFNYKMTDIQAALGLSQLKKLDGFIKRRREIAGLYDQRFSGLPVMLPQKMPGREPIYFRYVIQLRDGSRVEEFLAGARDRGAACMRPIFKPLHRLLGQGGFPGTDAAWERSVSIPIYPGLREDEIETVINAVLLNL